MDKTKGFDAKNGHWYHRAVFFMLLGQVVVLARTLAGNPPTWSIDHDRTVMLFSLAGAWSFIALLGLTRSLARPIYWLCVTALMFSATALWSGYSLGVCLIVGGSGLIVLITAWVLGDKGDVNLPGRTIKIRLPWM
jgi:hypothetical protein